MRESQIPTSFSSQEGLVLGAKCARSPFVKKGRVGKSLMKAQLRKRR